MTKDKHIEEFTNQFDKLVADQKLNINSFEKLMSDNIENYKNDLQNHAEKMLSNRINEKELITKKNKNGKKKDIS